MEANIVLLLFKNFLSMKTLLKFFENSPHPAHHLQILHHYLIPPVCLSLFVHHFSPFSHTVLLVKHKIKGYYLSRLNILISPSLFYGELNCPPEDRKRRYLAR